MPLMSEVYVFTPERVDSGESFADQLPIAHPELVAVASSITEAIHTLQGSDSAAADDGVRRVFQETNIWGALETHADDVPGIAGVMDALDSLELATGGEDSWAISVLRRVDNPELGNSLRELMLDRHPSLDTILERAIDHEPLSMTAEAPLVTFVESIVRPRYGSMVNWASSPSTPPYLKRIAERPYYARLCLESEIRRISAYPEHLADLQCMAADSAREHILDVMGVNSDIARAYGISLAERTLKFNDNGTISFAKGGGLDIGAWRDAMLSYMKMHSELGADRVTTLYHDWGIINLDRYTPAQLLRMCRLSESIAPDGTILDREFLETLQNSDVTFMESVQFGDFSNASTDHIAYEEAFDEDAIVLFTEIGLPVQLYRRPIELTQRFNIKPSRIAVSSHGHANRLVFDTQSTDLYGGSFRIGTRDADILSGGSSDPDRFFNIQDTKLARFFHDYMSPGRRTGRREVMLYGCYQAVRFIGNASNIETIAGVANIEDDVTVSGVTLMSAIDSETGELWEYNESTGEGERARLKTARRVGKTSVRVTSRYPRRRERAAA